MLIPETPEDQSNQEDNNEDSIAPNVNTVKLNVPIKSLPTVSIKAIPAVMSITEKKKKTKGKKPATKGGKKGSKDTQVEVTPKESDNDEADVKKQNNSIEENDDDEEEQEIVLKKIQDEPEVEVVLTKITFDEVKEKLDQASVNDKTLKSYCNA